MKELTSLKIILSIFWKEAAWSSSLVDLLYTFLPIATECVCSAAISSSNSGASSIIMLVVSCRHLVDVHPLIPQLLKYSVCR